MEMWAGESLEMQAEPTRPAPPGRPQTVPSQVRDNEPNFSTADAMLAWLRS